MQSKRLVSKYSEYLVCILLGIYLHAASYHIMIFLKRARCVQTIIHTCYRLSYMLTERRQSNTWYIIIKTSLNNYCPSKVSDIFSAQNR